MGRTMPNRTRRGVLAARPPCRMSFLAGTVTRSTPPWSIGWQERWSARDRRRFATGATVDRRRLGLALRRRLLAHLAVGVLAEQGYVAEVPPGLLDHVHDDPAQRVRAVLVLGRGVQRGSRGDHRVALRCL